MAPEQAAGDPDVDARADLYSFGVTAYEMLAGAPPFEGRTPSELLRAHLTEPPASLAAKRADTPATLVALVQACLAKSPGDRPASADDVMRELENVTTPAPSTLPAERAAGPIGVAARAKRTRRTRLAVTAASVLIAIVAGTWVVVDRRAPTLDPARVLVLPPALASSDPSLAPLAAMTPDVVTRGFAQMPWVRAASAPGAASPTASEGDLRALARAAGAGTVVTGALYVLGDSIQVQFRLVDGRTGTLLRALAPVRVPRAAGLDALSIAADHVLSGVGFISAPFLGVSALPLGEPPSFAAFREFEAAVALMGRSDPALGATVDTALIGAIERRLTRASALDPAFVQPRLWRGVRLTWSYHYPWVVAALDSIVPWVRGARDRMTLFESALAECILTSANGISDSAIEALRRLGRLQPNSPFLDEMPRHLADINRPAAAIAVATEWYQTRRGSDSLGVSVERRYWAQVADLQHFMGDHRAERAAARKARATAPNSSALLRRELFALSALGDTATLERLLDELATAAKGEEMFGFGGDILLIVGQDLIAHGHPEAGRRILRRAEAWFDSRRGGRDWAGQVPFRAAITYHALGRDDDALAITRELSRREPREVRYRGQIGRILALRGDSAGVRRELEWLASISPREFTGTPTYERAAITANLGRAHWDEAIALLEESITQGQGFNIRSRIHYFGDWLPMRDYPPFKRVTTPRG